MRRIELQRIASKRQRVAAAIGNATDAATQPTVGRRTPPVGSAFAKVVTIYRVAEPKQRVITAR